MKISIFKQSVFIILGFHYRYHVNDWIIFVTSLTGDKNISQKTEAKFFPSKDWKGN